MSYIIVDDNSKQITLDNFNDVSTKYVDPSDADITTEDVISGKIAYGADGRLIGNLVPLDTSDADATAGDIASGKTAYVDGEKITGTGQMAVDDTCFTITNLSNEAANIYMRLGNSGINLRYSVNNGNWNYGNLYSGINVVLPGNGKIRLVSSSNVENPYDVWRFSCDKQFKVSGRLDSIANYLSYKNFYNFFLGQTNLIDASELILPWTELNTYCFESMFEGCTNLINAPVLPAETLTNYCYRYMFENCSSLSHIKCLATNISATNSTYLWVTNVAPTGIFECAQGMSSVWSRGSYGIPNGWTVVEVSE